MAAESVCVAIFLLSCRVAVMKWSVKHVDLITTVVDVDMARSSLRDHDHDHDLRRGRCHSGRGGRGPDCRRFRGRVSRRGGGAPQLVFASIVSLVLYGSFVFVQTLRHRDYFLPLGSGEEEHASPPSNKVALISFGLLLVSLIAVVGLAKTLTPAVETMILSLGAPKAVVGVAIATLVLMPESLAALKAARANRLQT